MMRSTEEMKDTPPTGASKVEFARRPTMPNHPQGRKVTVSTNYYPIKLRTANMINVYSVKFEPKIPDDSTRLKKKVVRTLQGILNSKLGKYIYNGTNLFSPHDAGAAPIRLETADEGIKYTVEILIAHRICLSDILNPSKEPAKAQTAKMFFNIIIKCLLSALKMIPVGRTGKYLLPQEAVQINDYGIQIWPGYKTSVKLCGSGLLLEVDYTSRILMQQSALDYLRELRANCRGDFQGLARDEFRGRSVIAWYGNKLNYVVDDIDFKLSPSTYTFESRMGKMSMIDYMKKKYGVTIKDPSQPLFLSIKRVKDQKDEFRYLAPECFGMTGLPDELREDFNAMKQVAVYTKLTPDQRTIKMQTLLKMFNSLTIDHDRKEGEAFEHRELEQPGQILKDWGVEIDPRPVEIEAVVMPPMKVKLGGGKVLDIPPNAQFFFKQAVINPLKLDKWILVHTNRDYSVAEQFVENLYGASKVFGIDVGFPAYAESASMRATDFINAAEGAIARMPNPQIVVIILPPPASNEYATIKKWAITRRPPVLTQCAKTRTLGGKAIMAVCSKIILQMNAKRGGTLWQVKVPESLPKKSMMVGIDVSREAKSTFLGMATSFDPYFTRYFTQIQRLDAKQEISSTIGNLLLKGLNKFKEEAKTFLPELLVIYRDGVGETQTANLYTLEIESIMIAIRTSFKGYNPKIIFATINKKIHTRFFSKNGGAGYGRGGRGYSGGAPALNNPEPGTVVHSGITDTVSYEFLIMPQHVNEGTGTPARIHVLYDTSDLKADKFEELTNSLCYGYFNWQGAIRTPAPCKYAFTHAKLAAKYTKTIPDDALLHLPYFL